MWRREEVVAVWDAPKKNGGFIRPGRGKDIYVSTYDGSDGRSGRSWERAKATMAGALAIAETHDRIYFVGKITEQITISALTNLNLLFDIQIIGCGSLHHADQPGSGSTLYDYGASVWQPLASPTATTPNLSVYGRGWGFHNILFDAPTDAAALRLVRNSSSGTSEYDAGHATIFGCDFRNGLRGVEDSDGIFNALIERCVFETFDATTSAAAIITVTNTGVAASRRWRILDNFFQPESSTNGNERHIVMALNGSLIKGNVFGTVHGTGMYVDLNGGVSNVVTDNLLSGLYDTTDYRSGTGDKWYQNRCVVKATTAPDGVTILVPAA